MEIKEAIADLKEMALAFGYGTHKSETLEESPYDEAVNMAISALEKQVGKKPVRVNKNGDFDGNFEVVCPVCGIKLMERITTNEMSYPRIYNRTGYCYCGQKIEWE